MRMDQLSGLTTFLCVARKQSFTAAAAELRISPSAASQTISQLERTLGVRLLNRTTRSVQLTEAGRIYLEKVKPMVEELIQASENLAHYSDQPVGTLRINAPRIAYQLSIGPILPDFLKAHPRLAVDIDVDDGFVDIIEGGYDAGIRLGEFLEKDMVAVKLGGDMESAIVASPKYFKKHPPPAKPQDLKDHNCINFRLYRTRAVYRWEFEVGGKDVTLDVHGNLTVNDSNLAVRAALDGVGIAYVLDLHVKDLIEKGQLVRVLTPYSPRYPGLYLYYPSRKQIPARLKAFIQFFQANQKGKGARA